ncbi:protein TIC 40, chloroplastic-like [Hibiscus syriacus]|uniref:protein TIC 40, chloroplastic-like n=1 Tax=Hibiscus syriacus TaxID=106335 RepID=UPI001922E1A9|nr:protein TIC 40, chloroplastic-like [Hibiscus syriacus]
MENLNMALLSSSSYCSAPKLFPLGYNNHSYALKNPTKTLHFRTSKIVPRRSRIPTSAHLFPLPPRHPRIVLRKHGDERFASISSSSSNQQTTSSVGVNPNPTVPPPSSQIGSPLFWIGVGVGLSALFTWVASRLKNYAMQQAFKTMMGQMNTQNNQFSNTAFPSGSPFPFPFPEPPSAGPTTPHFPSSSQPAVTVDEPASKVEAVSVTDSETEVKSVKDEKETAEPKKYAFVDVSPEETVNKSAFEDAELSSSSGVGSPKDVSDNGVASKQDAGAFRGFQESGRSGPTLSVDALEKMLEDPTVQKMVYPYLPEEMRNPETFKWMLQNPQYRQQLQDMLNNMGGNTEWDNTMMESLKNFDLNSPEVKQQFDQIGLTPEEVISKIMANPEVAMAFQNPRVQAAIMECSQNPLSIAKYQNDKEVMDVFNKISELFPGMSGSY